LQRGSNAIHPFVSIVWTFRQNAKVIAENDSLLSQLLTTCIPLPPQERAEALEASAELEAAHAAAAYEGDSAVPASAEDPVDYHYVCLVKSHKNGRLYEMNGDLKGPVDRGPIDGDLLSKGAVDVLNTFIQREEGEFGFSLVALAKNPDS
jgi:ubiquitin carboxyl-terminal hydrolase L3